MSFILAISSSCHSKKFHMLFSSIYFQNISFSDNTTALCQSITFCCCNLRMALTSIINFSLISVKTDWKYWLRSILQTVLKSILHNSSLSPDHIPVSYPRREQEHPNYDLSWLQTRHFFRCAAWVYMKSLYP